MTWAPTRALRLTIETTITDQIDRLRDTVPPSTGLRPQLRRLSARAPAVGS
jgi:hypothetical protein